MTRQSPTVSEPGEPNGSDATRRVLMIAYHFPPYKGSSGLLRTYCFARDLREHGWEPTVLTASVHAYEAVEAEHEAVEAEHQPAEAEHAALDVSGIRVERAFAIDVARHLSIKGRYFDWLALPDRWSSWWLHGMVKGLALVRAQRPALIWSTYPIGTAHLIALGLARRTGIPWVADFRDPMIQKYHPQHRLKRRVNRRLERAVVARCDHAVFTAPGAMETYLERYPWLPPEKLSLIENGYDETAFARLEGTFVSVSGRRAPPLTLLHSGMVYLQERDPRALFDALAALKRAGRLTARDLRVVFRGSVHVGRLRKLARERGLDDMIVLKRHLPYHQALKEMMSVDGLLVLQSSSCNHQIPAKVYEYLRARRPILALTDPNGDTANLLRSAGVNTVAPLSDSRAIQDALPRFLDQMRAPHEDYARPHEPKLTRQHRARALARLFERVAQSG